VSRGQKAEGSAKSAKGQAACEVRLSQHPRARHQIRMAKGWAGLVACVFAGYASWHGGAPFFDSVLRALLWGVAAYLLVWFCAVQVWRQFAIAEVRAAEKVWLEQKEEAERLQRERAAELQAERAMAGSPGA
jgi:hypothetical protein